MKTLEIYTPLSRRQFLNYSAAVSTGFIGAAFLTGCAIDPVTGKSQIMMVSEQQEIAIDKQQSPFQISSDYGISQDDKVNRYVSMVGKGLLANVHRPAIPYSFKCVNATYINAYAFPGGTIAATRGILLKLDNEAELASLLGHELGHVNARHTAEQVSKGQLSSLLIGGLSIAAGTQGSAFGELTQQLGALGQGLFLSKYSRDNEREADSLGNEYMVKAGYPSKGFVRLMEMLDSLHKEKPGSAAMLFSTHPMSSERLDAAVLREKEQYRYSKEYSLNRDRYMDNTASLRRKRQTVELLQEGEEFLASKEYDKAENAIKKSIDKSREDYTAHVVMAKCLLIRKKFPEALSYADTAKTLYPSEAQGYYVAGIANIEQKKFSNAYKDFTQCEEILPGNPQMAFFRGYCLENNGEKDPAANQYMKYLKMINYQQNKYSQYAYARLKQWGYAR
ncbi:MAG: peptidase M48 Ste24p [Desulfobacterales bacterium RIFOXYA12_FULL_46_15]|nr:MAG: peptidase M48 Ste24p [Desulfobacterales bacterium RIFOXYA12_FULL_46_15]